ncbi:MAG TPA: hypothetical protein VFD92_09485 [Candidatus Binatia bacterium]|nr:hypothetical protein [Candidatus Binatia bacterium]
MARGGTCARLTLVAWAALAFLAEPARGAPPDPPHGVPADSARGVAPAAPPLEPGETAPPGLQWGPPAPHGDVALRDAVAVLAGRVDDLASGRTPPPWALALKNDVDGRVERLMEMQERLAARIETPLPRLDEPIILFTVAGSTLVLGFVIGRGLQRRRDRRDGRLRL